MTTLDLPGDAPIPLGDAASDSDRFDRAFERAAGAPLTRRTRSSSCSMRARTFRRGSPRSRAARHSILFESYIIADDARRPRVHRRAGGAGARGRARSRRLRLAGLAPVRRAVATARAPRRRGARASIRRASTARSAGSRATTARRSSSTARIGFVSGLCVSSAWLGDPRSGMRAVARHRRRDARARGRARSSARSRQVWRACGGEPLPDERCRCADACAQGDMRVRVIAGAPNAAGDVSARPRRSRRWRASTCGSPTRTSSARPRTCRRSRAAARDGVDVRLLVPGASDIPALSPLSRAGYRPLLEAGVRVFEWNGTMLHAKTAVADGLLGARRLDQPQHRELDGQLRARRRDRGPRASRAAMAAQYEIDLDAARPRSC